MDLCQKFGVCYSIGLKMRAFTFVLQAQRITVATSLVNLQVPEKYQDLYRSLSFSSWGMRESWVLMADATGGPRLQLEPGVNVKCDSDAFKGICELCIYDFWNFSVAVSA